MAKINLLPWREELRKKRQQDFLIAMGVSVAVTCLLFGAVYLQIESLKDYQNQRNEKIQEEITMVEKKITEIKDIEEKKNKLIAKIDLIQGFQASRPKIVKVFDELRKITPTGVYLVSMSKKIDNFMVNGKAESNASVSEYMHAIEGSTSFVEPKLKFVKNPGKESAKDITNNDFIMEFKLKQEKPKDDDKKSDNKAGAK
jgi:type IV pilus assembly protein PilN